MKRSGTCPKCESRDVIRDAMAIDRGENNFQSELTIATYRDPNAFLFKGKQTSTVSAWVCAACGYVEFYADDPASLRTTGDWQSPA